MLAKRYQDVFEVVEGVTCFKEPGFAQSNYWLNALLLDEDKADLRDSILQHANENGIGCRPAWTLMHELPMFRECPKMDLTNAENIKRRLINIPSSPFLGNLDAKT